MRVSVREAISSVHADFTCAVLAAQESMYMAFSFAAVPAPSSYCCIMRCTLSQSPIRDMRMFACRLPATASEMAARCVSFSVSHFPARSASTSLALRSCPFSMVEIPA